ncbi:MAG: NAD(P)H-hydrate dehydratase [Bacteroidetes bacterium]|nr:NAD(P)H-hydrate dehydratase [Bacteroidota bacterium]
MKILSVDNIRKADAYSIVNEPITSIDLMERASKACTKWIMDKVSIETKVRVVCGLGNNGGDGLAIARLLAEKDYQVNALIIRYSNKVSDDFSVNLNNLKKQENCEIIDIRNEVEIPEFAGEDVIIDALFGSGLSKEIKGFSADVVRQINQSKAIKIAIDIPSGLFADKSSTNKDSIIINADYTLSFQFPKYAFMFAENDQYLGDWVLIPIGLSEKFIASVDTNTFLTTKSDCQFILKKRIKFAHKGKYGHALLMAGSLGKMGAAVLASRACFRSGVGLLTTHLPSTGNEILQTAVPECMLSLDRSENYLSEVPNLSAYVAIGIGPGIGLKEQSGKAFKVLIQEARVPMVIDADALNMLAGNKTWLAFLPKGSILTPHPKEFERLVGKSSNDFERIELAKQFAIRFQLTLVLKGAHTVVINSAGDCYFNATGNPGMATAGSGDVLTGVILGLLAQGYSSLHSAILGVYLHGLAGDLAALKKSQEALIASDIVSFLGKAFKSVRL